MLETPTQPRLFILSGMLTDFSTSRPLWASPLPHLSFFTVAENTLPSPFLFTQLLCDVHCHESFTDVEQVSLTLLFIIACIYNTLGTFLFVMVNCGSLHNCVWLATHSKSLKRLAEPKGHVLALSAHHSEALVLQAWFLVFLWLPGTWWNFQEVGPSGRKLGHEG